MIVELKMYGANCDSRNSDFEMGDFTAYNDKDYVEEELSNSDWSMTEETDEQLAFTHEKESSGAQLIGVIK